MSPGRNALIAACLCAVAQVSVAGPVERSLPEARARVEHHLHEVEVVAGRLGTVLSEPCTRFPTRDEWTHFQEAQLDDVVLLLAHLEQAWIEAKAGRDAALRREAKAPKRRTADGQRFVEKFQTCAAENDASFDPFELWRRIEREIPPRQAEIALPE